MGMTMAQADPGRAVGSSPDCPNEVSHNISADEGSYLQFLKNATSVKLSEVQLNELCLYLSWIK